MDIETILIIIAGILAVIAAGLFIAYKYMMWKTNKFQEALYG